MSTGSPVGARQGWGPALRGCRLEQPAPLGTKPSSEQMATDLRAMVAGKGALRAVPLTKDHRPGEAAERGAPLSLRQTSEPSNTCAAGAVHRMLCALLGCQAGQTARARAARSTVTTGGRLGAPPAPAQRMQLVRMLGTLLAAWQKRVPYLRGLQKLPARPDS